MAITRVLFALVLFLSAGADVRAQSNSDAMQLMRRVFGENAHVTVNALPPGWTPPVQLPQNLPILGSFATPGTTVIYYQPADAKKAYDAYYAQLTAAGFAPYGLGPSAQSANGFIAPTPSPGPGLLLRSTPSQTAMLCRDGQSVSLSMPGTANDKLDVTVYPKSRNASCGSPVNVVGREIRSPLPRILAPPGMKSLPFGGGFMSLGIQGTPETVTSSALFAGGGSIASLVHWVEAQMRSAGWKVASQLVGTSSANVSFQQKGSPKWIAWLTVLKGIQPQTLSARLEAVQAGLPQYRSYVANDIGAAPVFGAPWIPQTITASQKPAILELLRRLVTQNGFRAGQVFLGKLPPDFSPRIPLPSATPLASSSLQFQPGPFGQREYNIYYTVTRGAMTDYFNRLKAQGWQQIATAIPQLNGFQYASFPVVQTFCKSSLAPITVAGAENSNNVTISVQRLRNGFSCDTMQGLQPNQRFVTPLPRLDAPPGAVMLLGTAGVRAGNSGAMIQTTQSIAQVLDVFTSRFVSKGWSIMSAVTDADIGSRSYTYRDAAAGGQRWQAVLTLYRSFADPGTYYAFLDVTKLP